MTDFDLAGFSKALADRAEAAATLTASVAVHRHISPAPSTGATGSMSPPKNWSIPTPRSRRCSRPASG